MTPFVADPDFKRFGSNGLSLRRQRALRESKRRWLYVFDDLTGRAFKVRRRP